MPNPRYKLRLREAHSGRYHITESFKMEKAGPRATSIILRSVFDPNPKEGHMPLDGFEDCLRPGSPVAPPDPRHLWHVFVPCHQGRLDM